ncbi:MAG: hypothetical protein AAGK37_07675 [Pseudomonadota bacterium]
MKKPEVQETVQRLNDEPKPCWQEILQASFDGLVCSSNSLEAYLDRLERSS